MADRSPFSTAGDDTGVETDREGDPGTPRWVKVFGIIAIVVALLFVIMLVAGGGRHGPARHRVSDGNHSAKTPPIDVTQGGDAAAEIVHQW